VDSSTILPDDITMGVGFPRVATAAGLLSVPDNTVTCGSQLTPLFVDLRITRSISCESAHQALLASAKASRSPFPAFTMAGIR